MAFIYTTWDRFCAARTLADLYSEADEFVDRVFHALRQTGLQPERIWQASRRDGTGGAELRLACQSGTVIASTELTDEAVSLVVDSSPQAVREGVSAVLAAVKERGGPKAGDPAQEG